MVFIKPIVTGTMTSRHVRKTAIITGAGRGMGAAIARELSARGYRLVLLTPSDSAEKLAGELGATAVLMNTGIAHAKDPVAMARAMRLGIEAGRLAYEAGRMPRRLYASASSPIEGTAVF